MCNYFELFEIEEHYKLNFDEVESKYLQLQKKHHPDNFDDIEQQLKAAEKIIQVNEAYEILKNEFKSVIYFLEQKGYNLTDKQVQQELSDDDLMILLDAKEFNNFQEIKELSLSFKLRLMQAYEKQNKNDIIHYLAKLIFFTRALNHV